MGRTLTISTAGTSMSDRAHRPNFIAGSPPLDVPMSRARELATLRPVLSPVGWKAVAYAKGWSLRELADYWGLTPEYVRRLAANPKRAAHWDDAVRGLPSLGPARRLRQDWVEQAQVEAALAAGQPVPSRPAKVPKTPGFRYHDYMVVGAVVAVSKHLGEVADEGARGLVLEVIRSRTQEQYRVLFEGGDFETFEPDLVDEYLVTTGLEQASLAGYVWRGEEVARREFELGLFAFGGE